MSRQEDPSGLSDDERLNRMSWSPFGVFLSVGVGAAVAMGIIDATAPCNPTAPIMSIGGAREMPDPYGWISFLLNAVAPICLGIAAGMRRRHHFLVGTATWFLSGVVLWFVSNAIWQQNCPP
jgi:hypothetical protein